jgi:hypothetical protein
MEMWLCDNETLQFFDQSGEIPQSKLAPDFPKKISR